MIAAAWILLLVAAEPPPLDGAAAERAPAVRADGASAPAERADGDSAPADGAAIPAATAPAALAPTRAPLVASSVQDFSAFVDATKSKIVHLEILDHNGKKRGNGTGFVVRPDGVLVTNDHVVDGAPEIVAVFDNKDRVKVTGAWVRDPDHDIAILQLARRPSPYPALVLGTSTTLRTGQPIAVVGSPLGLEHSLSTGMISAIRPKGLKDAKKDAEKQRLLQITAPISPGSSGSPVMRLDGTVVGVATLAFLGQAQALNFAVPVEIVAGHLATLDDDAKTSALTTTKASGPTPLQRGPWINLGISAGVLAAIFGLWFWLSRRERRR